jgi:hypothetical protein
MGRNRGSATQVVGERVFEFRESSKVIFLSKTIILTCCNVALTYENIRSHQRKHEEIFLDVICNNNRAAAWHEHTKSFARGSDLYSSPATAASIRRDQDPEPLIPLYRESQMVGE